MKKRTSRLLSILLALCLALALLPGTALATGYFDPETGTITGCDLEDTEVNIPSVINGIPITSIAIWAYRGHSELISVTIPESVTSIGSQAFLDCSSLTSFSVASGNPAYSSVDGVLFSADQTVLVAYPAGRSDPTYHIPASVTTIGDSAFASCNNLTSMIIPDGVTSIGNWGFNSSKNLTSVTIPDSVTYIEQNAFGFCESLADIYYGGSESQWQQIDIGIYNDLLRSATIHYNSTGPAPSASESIPVTVNGVTVTWTDAAPFIDANDRTMVPLRAVADAMGLEVNWDANTREASFANGSKTIFFPIDSTTARTSGGDTVEMDTAAVIVNERTYAPIRYLAEYFGYTVGWDEAARAVSITG